MSPRDQRPRLPAEIVGGGVLIALLLTVVIYFPVRIFGEREERAREHHGAVTIDYCQYSGRSNDTADCVGTFKSDDDALVVPNVNCLFIVHPRPDPS